MQVPNAKTFSYADDTCVVFTGISWDDVRADAELGLATVATWLRNNLLTLNTNKTNYISFSINKSTQPKKVFNIRIHTCDEFTNWTDCGCKEISKEAQTKYLGVMIDQFLSWYPHLEQVMTRIRKLTWIFRVLRHVVPRKTNKENTKNIMNEIYVSLVQSVLVYCIPLWGGAAKTRFLGVERAQRALLKLMYFKKRRFPTTDLYQIAELLSVRKLYLYHLILKKHREGSYNPSIVTKRRKYAIVQVPVSKTKFARAQYKIRSACLYNKFNKHVYIYDKQIHQCKKLILSWLKNLTYEETEFFIKSTN